jgi:hypothetical protein
MIDLADATSRLDATRAARESARSTWSNRELVARNAAHGLALHISQGVCTYDAYCEAQSAANAATAEGARDAGERMNAVRTGCREVTLKAEWVLALLRAKWAASEAIREAAGSRTDDDIWSAAYHTAVDDLGALTPALHACDERNALSAFAHPAQQQLVDICLPMLNAFEAGLLCYWVSRGGLGFASVVIDRRWQPASLRWPRSGMGNRRAILVSSKALTQTRSSLVGVCQS